MRSSIRRTYRTRKSARGGDRTNYWLSFSDLMTALVLVIILVLFHVLYQYFTMYDDYQEKRNALVLLQDTLSQTEEDIAAQSSQLSQAQLSLSEKEEQLSQAQQDLTAAQEDLAVKQILLAAAQEASEKTQEELAQQKTQLQETLDTLAEQQTQIQTQQTQLETQQTQLEQLVGIRTRIIASLSDALKDADISATVDPTTGAIALASDVLFKTGKADLSDEGRARIDDFLPVYLEVLFSDEYQEYISEIIVEGHTDSVGGYITNLKLSQNRAFSVASYVLDDAYTAISYEQRMRLREIVTANGRSYSNLIYTNGVEDKDASRRVVFKFRLTDEQMVEQLQAILEANP